MILLYINCNTELNENEALISDNGVYILILQKTVNLIIKEGKRILWSSMSANVTGFIGPDKLSLSPKGELILRDKYNFILWKTYNIGLFDGYGTDDNYALVLSDLSELQIINNELFIIWSSLPYKELNNHFRYKSFTLYDIKDCNEANRISFNYYLFNDYKSIIEINSNKDNEKKK
ncbi:hypothetical protein H8356DRAFT_940443 [Neocallimastix lanati (nom. inval.)]|nr:hypothetical protein H8356DRAFT_940443 [Neocallimastix sp. JGI-2020a]